MPLWTDSDMILRVLESSFSSFEACRNENRCHLPELWLQFELAVACVSTVSSVSPRSTAVVRSGVGVGPNHADKLQERLRRRNPGLQTAGADRKERQTHQLQPGKRSSCSSRGEDSLLKPLTAC